MIVTRGLGRKLNNPQSIPMFGMGRELFSKIIHRPIDNDWMQERHDAQIAQANEESALLAFITTFLMIRH